MVFELPVLARNQRPKTKVQDRLYLFDTSPNYGRSEELLGQALGSDPGIVMATKCPPERGKEAAGSLSVRCCLPDLDRVSRSSQPNPGAPVRIGDQAGVRVRLIELMQYRRSVGVP